MLTNSYHNIDRHLLSILLYQLNEECEQDLLILFLIFIAIRPILISLQSLRCVDTPEKSAMHGLRALTVTPADR